jgi:hypothetical protein
MESMIVPSRSKWTAVSSTPGIYAIRETTTAQGALIEEKTSTRCRDSGRSALLESSVACWALPPAIPLPQNRPIVPQKRPNI